MTEKLVLNGNDFFLLPQKAIFWVNENAILLSDIHLGKATHFRKNGIPLPSIAGKADLTLLQDLIETHQATKVFIIGDLFHSNYNSEWIWFQDFIASFPITSFILLRGNHDILPAFHLKMQNFQTLHKYIHNGICLIHEPRGNEPEYVICGHIHPGFTLRGKARQVLRLPCFVIGSNRTILPAFGGLTGLANFETLPHDKICVIADNQIIELSSI